MQCRNWDVGVCSWSLRADVAGIAGAMREMNLQHVHLAVGPALGDTGARYLKAVMARDWTITGTMIDFPQEDYSSLEAIRRTGGVVPDECWETNCRRFVEAAQITADLGVRYLSLHAGFIDESDVAYTGKMLGRIWALANIARENGVVMLLETGQETAADLRDFLDQLGHESVGVNFDPANMVLYDKGDPIEAVGVLGPWIRHVHVKDAVRTRQPGTWGREVPWGEGDVGPAEFVKALADAGFRGAMAVEREAGDDRLGDIALAVSRLAATG